MPCSKREQPPLPAIPMPAATQPASAQELLDPLTGPVVALEQRQISVPETELLQTVFPVGEIEGADKVWTTAERQVVVGQLLEDHFDRVYRYAYYLSGCASVAEDIAQEVFLRAFRSVHQLRNQQASVGWLLTIARNEFGRYCQSRKSTKDIEDFALTEDSNHIRQVDCQDWIQYALDQLPSEFRTVVLMFYFEEKSYAQIATQLELPMGTVMSRLSRARNHLKQALESQAAFSNEPKLGALAKEPQ